MLQPDSEWDPSLMTVFDKESGRIITLTVLDGQELVETCESIGRMPFTQFASLHSVSSLMTQNSDASQHACSDPEVDAEVMLQLHDSIQVPIKKQIRCITYLFCFSRDLLAVKQHSLCKFVLANRYYI